MPVSKKIKILYFAMLREKRGQKEETLTTEAETARDLYEELLAGYRLRLPPQAVKVVINDAFKPWDTALRDNDCVAFIPPVAGG